MKRTIPVITLSAFSLVAAQAVDLFVPGVLKHEFFPGANRAQVEAGTAGAPATLEYITSFELPVDFSDNYARRVSGLFIPPATGNYVFFVCSDDDSDLFLSTDETPANKRLIAQETAWSSNLQWTTSGGGSTLAQKRSDRFKPAGAASPPFAAGIPLTAGKRYYIEGVQHEGSGGDNFAATYKLVPDADPADGTDSAITGNTIGVLAPATPVFVSQPASRRVVANQTVTLSVVVDPPAAKLQWFRNSATLPGETNPTYQTPPLTAGDNGVTYHVVASNNGNNVQSSNAVISLGQLVSAPGAKEELWFGAVRADVEAGTQDAVTPDRLLFLSKFEVPDEQGDDFAERLSAIFKPQVTGDYVFFIAADDDSDLFLSTDATAANKRLIAQEVNWSSTRNWTGNEGGTNDFEITQKRSDKWVADPLNPPATPPFANGIHLVAGNSYYIEAVHHEGGGGDNLAATFKVKTDPDPQPGDATRLTAFAAVPLIYAPTLDGAYIAITNFPQSITGLQNRTAALSIGATSGYNGDTSGAAPRLNYQWQSAPAGSSTFTNIPNAAGPSLTTPLLKLSDNGTQFRVALLAGDVTTNSSVATLTVTPDTTPPRPVEVTSVNAAFTVVTLTFDELMDKTSAETGANYVFSPGNVAGASATLDASGTDLTITSASPLTPNTTNILTITGVKDLAGNPVAPGTTISFSFMPVTYAANILFDGPLGYYRFEETSGSVATNSGTTGGNGAYYTGDETATGEGGTPSSAKGDPGPRPPAFAGFDANNHAATFSGPSANGGADDWVDTKNQYLQDRAAFTLEYWVKPVGRTNADGTVAWPNRIGIVGQNDAIEYGFITPDTIQIWTPNGGALNTTYSFPDGEWHHVATIADGTSLKTYYDGILQGTGGNATRDYGTSLFNVHIGGGGVFDGTGNYFTGQIDEAAIFDKAIPAARVAAHYKAGKEGGVITTSGEVTPIPTSAVSILIVTRSGNNLTIAWTPPGGTLQSTPALKGPATVWTDLGTADPATITIGTGNSFYRVKSQ